MLPVPENTGGDLVAFGLLALVLILFGSLRLVDPRLAAWRIGFRLGLWLALWQGAGLAIRMAGVA